MKKAKKIFSFYFCEGKNKAERKRDDICYANDNKICAPASHSYRRLFFYHTYNSFNDVDGNNEGTSINATNKAK
jgi:hypothetical protein